MPNQINFIISNHQNVTLAGLDLPITKFNLRPEKKRHQFIVFLMYRRTCTSPRWKGFDYSSANLYFVTSCVKRRIPAFGHLENGKMILNEYGKIAHRQWLWLAENFDYVSLHEFVIMPDHMHGIIEIVGGNKIKPLSDLMGAFKTTSSKQIHLAGLSNFKWQRSFHDRVIRNDCELYNIAQYIIRNPSSTSRR